ncbi:DEAD/DEAH box helicase [Azohydromonas caseinilytica]|uniref:DEAD/DEAH box helicase n=1 Tax=Azohydromonas caseinilytica TaxID=2728836 RepID=A0A848FD59_9BURK|nr:DEAD/DEAH box helicase [Azohydromonas caseinilytica]NML18147.1 DEAD/DEAH box helicase [Azohydromonas caseinilytica]
MSFASLGLCPALVRATHERGYAAPTPIQASAIPAVLQGRDLQAQAHTGSGKTAAFALPLLQQLVQRGQPGARPLHALVLVPTRELAVQVGAALRELSQGLRTPARIAVLFGGVSINPQLMGLRGGADIAVATPGRLLDVVAHNALKLGGVQTLVLDEADRLLDLGFADELAHILALLPPRRQNLCFSATFPAAVQALAARLLHEPLRIELPPEPEARPAIEQRAIEVDAPRRTTLLRHLLAQHQWPRLLVFVATQHATGHVAEKLQRTGIAAAALHGQLAQGTRRTVLADFEAGRLQVLVATDLAARGLDFAALPAVLNYDLPRSAADYTHRIGRTGRAGQPGVAISFVTPESEAHFRLIEKRQQQRVPRERVPGFESAAAPAAPPPAATGEGGIKGKRKSKKDKAREAAHQASKR